MSDARMRIGQLAWEVMHLPPGKERAHRLTGLGDLIANEGQHDEARDCYRAALMDVPEHTQALFGLALLALEEGDEEGAVLFGCHALESALAAGEDAPPRVCTLLIDCQARDHLVEILQRYGQPFPGGTE